MTVFIAESGDYEQRSVDHVGISLDATVRAIRNDYARHGSVVIWNEVRQATHGTGWTLTGHITEQGGHRQTRPLETDHDITEWTVSE